MGKPIQNYEKFKLYVLFYAKYASMCDYVIAYVCYLYIMGNSFGFRGWELSTEHMIAHPLLFPFSPCVKAFGHYRLVDIICYLT